jgi:NAD(P)H-hydrate epimerase
VIVEIGLDKKFIKESSSPYRYVLERDVRKVMRGRSRFDHKGTFGHALLISGSYGKMGAAILAARAALRSGLGLLTIHTPGCGYEILQAAVPEAMAKVDDDVKVFTGSGADLSPYNVIAIGPGLGKDAKTVRALEETLRDCDEPMVIDADALNIVAENRHLLSLIPAGSILTPHPKEFERLAGPWKDDFERLAKQKELATALKSIVIVKGAYTTIATDKGMVYFNSTGNPGMATGGTGDVLTGIITGLLAQGYSSKNAALIGVFLHGFAGDLAVQECGMDSLIASDLIGFLPNAFQRITRK